MSDYSKQTVAQLKQELGKRGLAKDGVKADLIKRLTENDETKTDVVEVIDEDNNEPAAIEQPETVTVDEQEKATPASTTAAIESQPAPTAPAADSTTTPAAETSTVATEAASPETKQSDEEKYNTIVAELKKRISRSQRFNNTTDKEAEAALKRIEKFGIEAAGKIIKTDRQLHDRPGSSGHRNNGARRGNRRFSNSSRPIAAAVTNEDSEKLQKRKERFA
ncbi:hypothetical protein DV495_001701 [Geotrichum candidum]|uniref:Similar to Saccharomyces cerevisiae YER063W THO1 Conserved nuclear RNA-binding protein n=1 Tax=Geotrichum candidum TaxID=1173061 RepID=A0A0J9XKJ5_GEOCN|nr:hypothetical protein DV452_004730 [Geotrichum candidum]KAI9210074.1 hypothetical protein DS838_005051 [Geotrichum bryndzae]KAF5131992.1 hypothetical protein DV495_001701 [Geotrichum candidum]KAF7498767.1 hypothetical protein DV113_003182 [Geotrichum candidum]KAI8132121.1 hypothetical protein DUD61_004224 [Geotrichum candidum]